MYAPWLPDRTKAEREARTNISGAERLNILDQAPQICMFI